MKHTPVLLDEVVEIFKPINEFTPTEGGGIFVDATIGSAKHAEAVLRSLNANLKSQISKSSPPWRDPEKAGQFKIKNVLIAKNIELRTNLIGIDQDYSALELASENLKEFSDQVTLVHGNFRDIKSIINDLVPKKVHLVGGLSGILADLGVSSMQIDSEDRGFSFKYDAPLDMRMAHANSKIKSQNAKTKFKNLLRTKNYELRTGDLTAELIIKTWNEAKIADILWQYGEERFSRKIARAIVQNRKDINSTKDLAQICEKCIPPRFRKYKIHPATKTFQALRIAVNDEIEALKDFLNDAPELLAKGGRLAVISFHSLEDRLVKQRFNELTKSNYELRSMNYELLTKHPIIATDAEVSQNPRARSAKLRAIVKV